MRKLPFVVADDDCVDVIQRYMVRIQFFFDPFIQLIVLGNLPSEVAIKDKNRFLRVLEIDLSDLLNVRVLDTIRLICSRVQLEASVIVDRKPDFKPDKKIF